MDSQNEIINRIFELMEQRGINARQLSEDTGISKSSFTEWKKGRAKPKTDTLVTLARYFGVPVEYLTGTNENINPLDMEIQNGVQDLDDNQKAELLKYMQFLKQY